MFYLYIIENMINNKKYVGWSLNPNERKYKHFKGKGSKLVAHAINKYGIENFSHNTVGWTDNADEIKKWEIQLISGLNTMSPNGYNLTEGGDGTVGVLMSEETRKKHSEVKRGIPLSEEHKKNLSEARKGEKHWWSRKGVKQSEKAKQKMSQNMKGRIPWNKGMEYTDEQKEKIVIANRNKITDEAREKMSKSKIGHVPWNKGKKMSKEYCDKISQHQTGRVPWNKGKKTGQIPWNKKPEKSEVSI